MAEEESRRANDSRPGSGQVVRLGRRRPYTWEISDSDAEGAKARVVSTQAPSTGKHRATAKALRADQVLRSLVVCVDPGEGPGWRGWELGAGHPTG